MKSIKDEPKKSESPNRGFFLSCKSNEVFIENRFILAGKLTVTPFLKYLNLVRNEKIQCLSQLFFKEPPIEADFHQNGFYVL